MPTLQIELYCPFEVYPAEWDEILREINRQVLSGKYSNISASIVSQLTPVAGDGACCDCKTNNFSAGPLGIICGTCEKPPRA